ncbi:aminotransferase [Robbsia andropogonis]|uniref:Aminotransferase n=1 Tax=Robbsia andropogonis TaxID=28092 RepID=A0A0F5K0B1_9BURK|nr:pyridoxal phosphate-dependent aminotransferase [Robbsia andropogonis]KKB63541.1 aminotransferase [Robbsia andropogonis]MCP1116807.1 pyridoxal phosphate-dependent aminotransferase [Robbsia andropogonis]MCP1126514.1 pyridoxal phosphate-dependent aminotransferase [Robbsia andropogonis]
MTSAALAHHTPSFPSKLPKVGTTIFTVMSALAAEKKAINLGQGFPDFDCDPALIDAVSQAMRDGHNQYPPMAGWPALREAIANKVDAVYGRSYHTTNEITVTSGATQALLSAILCAVQPGDEVIVIEPSYDSYVPAIELAGGKPVRVPLSAPDYMLNFDAIQAALTHRTRMLIINTPHNPTGRTWKQEDIEKLAEILHGTNVLVLSDEVYEHMVFDGQSHASIARHPALAARSFIVSSFGKTFHVTGWKLGYVLAPAPLTAEFRKVHQFNVFTANTPMQAGIASYMQDPSTYANLAQFYQSKRDLFRDGLAQTRFTVLPCEGTFFQCVDYTAISDLNEVDFCRWLINEAGVAAIPMSAFYQNNQESGVVRFCFAKKDDTLRDAIGRLSRL